jgi:hypothetical protein
MIVKINNWPISTQFNQIDEVHLTPHKGVDFAIQSGTSVPSIGDGIVKSVTDEGAKSFGKSVTIHQTDGTDAIYGHLSKFNVKEGQTVHVGDIIGYSGSTGDSTGPHLHLQVMQNGKAINPLQYAQTQKDIPWWDIQGQIERGITNAEHAIEQRFIDVCHALWHGFVDFLGIAFPTIAGFAILWWMIPFFPKADKWAPKIIGSSLLCYMFYCLIRSAYS